MRLLQPLVLCQAMLKVRNELVVKVLCHRTAVHKRCAGFAAVPDGFVTVELAAPCQYYPRNVASWCRLLSFCSVASGDDRGIGLSPHRRK